MLNLALIVSRKRKRIKEKDKGKDFLPSKENRKKENKYPPK
jgi:hypothetical protein